MIFCVHSALTDHLVHVVGPRSRSEIWYGPGDCYNGNVGDSWTAMGRIGLSDARSRARTGDAAIFSDVLLEPLLDDVLTYTWLRERYGCDGKQQGNRTWAYFEYPVQLHGGALH